MWNRKDLKHHAKGALKRNYLGIVITCMLVSIALGYAVSPVKSAEQMFHPNSRPSAGASAAKTADNARQESTSNTEIVDSFLGGMGIENDTAKRWTGGVLSQFANNTQGAGSVIYGIMNTINQIVFSDRLSPGIIIGAGAFISFLIFIFLKNVLQIGFCRYLLEARIYSRTRLNRILFPWHIKRCFSIVKIMFVKWLFQLFWTFTIVGGLIKAYSYRLVPFIAAENPDISPREAISLSREMMKGNKWRAFVLDISFLPWSLLNMLTFNLLEILFIQPYKKLTNAEFYMALRAQAKAGCVSGVDRLCDVLLDKEEQIGEYPVNDYFIPPAPARHWARADYNRSYSVSSLILIFFAFSFVGWVWEVSLHLFKDGVFVNRGVSFGPWLPIYGTGGVLVLILLKKFRSRPVLMFAATMVLCGVVEYATSWYLEFSKGMKWWDYSGYFLNLNGRICLEGLLVFALGGCAAVYLIAPALDSLFQKIPQRQKRTICTVLLALFCADQVYSHFNPNSGKGITDYQ